MKPLLWDAEDARVSPVFRRSIAAVSQQFQAVAVTREFKVTGKIRNTMLASRKKGNFSHMYLDMPEPRVSRETFKGFGTASTKTLATMLAAVIKGYSLNTVRQATQMLERDMLPHADNHKAAARWLLDLLENDKVKRNDPAANSMARYNLGYRYAASAFVGCISQLKNGVLSKLLDAIDSNQSWNAISLQWEQLTEPTKYLRPQVAPTQGNIDASERLFASLGITEADLQRRFLVFDDIPQDCIMWQHSHPTSPTKSTPKLFANIIPKDPTSPTRVPPARPPSNPHNIHQTPPHRPPHRYKTRI